MDEFLTTTHWVAQNLGLVVALFGIYGSWIKMGLEMKGIKISLADTKQRLTELEEREEGYRHYKDVADSNVRRIENLECANKQFDIALAKIESRLAAIETNILWVKDTLIEKNKK
jgi:hypothetical protein